MGFSYQANPTASVLSLVFFPALHIYKLLTWLTPNLRLDIHPLIHILQLIKIQCLPYQWSISLICFSAAKICSGFIVLSTQSEVSLQDPKTLSWKQIHLITELL